VVHIAGKKNVVADILSRYPCAEASIDPQDLDYFPHILAIKVSEVVNCYKTILNHVYQHIQTLTFEGIPEEFQRRVHLERQKYFIEKEKLYKRSSHRSLLVSKIADRPSVLQELHNGHGHFALQSTFKRARTLYYWPKYIMISRKISNIVQFVRFIKRLQKITIHYQCGQFLHNIFFKDLE